MKKLFTDKESAAISFLAVTFLFGMGVDYYRDKTFEEGLAGSITKLIAEDKKFKEAALMLQSDYDITSANKLLRESSDSTSVILNGFNSCLMGQAI